MDSKQRERILKQSIDAFSQRLSSAPPKVIVVVLKKISALVREAAAKANLQVPIYELPFPGSGHQNKYIDALKDILRRHLDNET